MDRYIRYNEEFQLAICIACRVGIPSSYVLRHYREKHNAVWSENRSSLKKHLENLDLRTVTELNEPLCDREPIRGLEIFDGWCCGEHGCTHCGTSVSTMKNHARMKHGKDAAHRKEWTKCKVQTLLGHPYIR